jgi:hypothetical protein
MGAVMAKRAASLALLCVIGAGLAACAPDNLSAVNPNVVPTNRYKGEIVETLRALFSKNDTTSVSNAVISDPVLRSIGGEQRYVACLRYTAHYADLSMATSTERVAYFYGGHLNQLVETTKEQCGNAIYRPFAELNALCLGKACK